MSDAVDFLPQIREDGFTEGKPTLYLAEDEEDIGKMEIEVIQELLADRIGKIVWLKTVRDVYRHLEEYEADLWVTDLTLAGGAVLDVGQMADFLLKREKRTGWIIMTGSNLTYAEEAVTEEVSCSSDGDDDECLLCVEYSEKPFRVGDFILKLKRILDYVEGKPICEPEQIEEVVVEETVREFLGVCNTVKDLLEELMNKTNGGYKDFRAVWDLGLKARYVSLVRDLEQVGAAKFVLEICVHDVNNVLNRWNGEGPTEQQWAKARFDLSELIERSLIPFKDYCDDPDMEYPFWRNQDLGTVLGKLKADFPNVECDVDLKTSVFCPAGSLWSMLRTFSSNFNKVRRRSTGMGDLFLKITEENGELVFVISDNLRGFGEDQLEGLFDKIIRSDRPQYDMGTGLVRTAQLAELSGGRIDSYHLRREGVGWVKKSPGRGIEEINVDQIPSHLGEGMTKVFEFRLLIASDK